MHTNDKNIYNYIHVYAYICIYKCQMKKKNNKEVRVLHFYILRSSLTEDPKHYSQSRLFKVIDTCSSAKFLTCESLHILQQTPTNQRNRVSVLVGHGCVAVTNAGIFHLLKPYLPTPPLLAHLQYREGRSNKK